MTIGERIREKAEGEPNTTPDWYANELYAELSNVAETRFPEIGELCFFTYTASFPSSIIILASVSPDLNLAKVS